MKVEIQHTLLAVLVVCLAALQDASACSPKAVRSVFKGRKAAEAHHQAKKAKYLAGKTKPIGQRLGLSAGGIPMEQVGVKNLQNRIKYLESVSEAIKKTEKDRMKLAKAVSKAEAKGKPLKGWAKKAKKAQDAQDALKRSQEAARQAKAAAAPMAEAAAQSGSKAAKAAKAAKKLKPKKGKMPDNAAPPMPPAPPPRPPKFVPPAAAAAAEAAAKPKKRRFGRR